MRSFVLSVLLLAIAVAAPAARVETLAGSTSGGGHEDGHGLTARFSLPRSVAADAMGNLYVADTANHVIRRITPDGHVTTVAGRAGSPGDADGFGSSARFRFPSGIAVDRGTNAIYVADRDNHAIRRITLGGQVTTFAGAGGVAGTADGVGSEARFNLPRGVAVAATGIVYVADTANDAIRRITPDGMVTTLAGSKGNGGFANGLGEEARFEDPYDVAVDPVTGNVVVADTFNHVIRKITPEGSATLYAGFPGSLGDQSGFGFNARFAYPWGVEADSSGNIYVADSLNRRIRRITLDTHVMTFAGAFVSGSRDDVGINARFGEPSGLTISGDALFVADANNHAIRRVTLAGAVVTTFAGSAPESGTSNGTGTEARFRSPAGVTTDAAGNAYIAEIVTIRKVTPDGVVTLFAGVPGESGNTDGAALQARFNAPRGLVFDRNGNLFVADSFNHTIRKITPEGTVSTFAGSPGMPGDQNGTGAEARFWYPWGLAADSDGNLYVTDSGNHKIRKISPAGVVTTFAGSGRYASNDGLGPAADFAAPYGIAIDAARNLYVADYEGGTIRKITQAGVVTTIAGSGFTYGTADGIGSAARFSSPAGIAIDAAGNLFVADTSGHTIRRISPDGIVTTIAGLPRSAGNVNGRGRAARFFFPFGLAMAPNGTLIIADLSNHAIRVVDLSAGKRRSARH